jgi:AraC-like DNA-binding protein
MIWGIKDMIAGCIERMRQQGCGACPRRDACASLWPRRFAVAGGPPAAAAFLAFLGLVAKSIEAWAREQSGERAKAPAQQAAERPRQSTPKPLAEGDGPFCRQVAATVEPLLEAGAVRVGTVARVLGCSRQTLYRRLKAEGTTFEQLLDALRRRLALRLLGEGLSVKEIAYRLGFSDPAAFSRAFKRWTGASPRDMRP